ncbi:hypothetical protein scyTo_0022367, partial [Scyliorhinus torazame]|nr:hypothetical protein [Scyliorhinus torazame]
EEQEARAKADKIKLALEKLKEAKVKKVSYKHSIPVVLVLDLQRQGHEVKSQHAKF